MSVFSTNGRKTYKGPVFGGPKDGQVMVNFLPVVQIPKLRGVEAYLEQYASGQRRVTTETFDRWTYRHSRHGFWYEAGLGENEARKRFCEGDDVEGWADDDA